MADGAYTMVYEMDGVDGPVTCAFDGNKYYISMTAEGEEIIILANDDGVYMLMPSYQMMMPLSGEEGFELPADPFAEFDALQSFTTGAMQMEGRSYDYEEYSDENGALTRYLFDGADLAYVVSAPDSDEPTVLKVVSMEKGADPALFEIPASYTSIG